MELTDDERALVLAALFELRITCLESDAERYARVFPDCADRWLAFAARLDAEADELEGSPRC